MAANADENAGINVGSKFYRNRERITSLRDIKPIIFRGVRRGNSQVRSLREMYPYTMYRYTMQYM